MRRRRGIGFGLGGLLLLVLGCQSVHQDRPVPEVRVQPGRTTRAELYRVVGPPQRVQPRTDGGHTLVYTRVRTRGVQLGLSLAYSPVRMGSQASATATVLVELGPDDVVRSVRRLGDASPHWSLWPGGEGSAD